MNTKSIWNPDAPMVIAHRGASLHAPENTMAAFLHALQHGADGIELDVQMTADSHVVVCHDRTLDRTTTGTGLVSAHTLKEILDLDAGSYFAPDFVGERVPTLREVLQKIADHVMINIELKTIIRSWSALSEAVVSLVRELNNVRRVMVSSFSPMALRRVRCIAPEISVGLIIAPMEPKWLRILFSRIVSYDVLHPNRNLIDEEMIQRQHGDGKRVIVWTLNEPAEIEKFVGFGVDGLITDAPEIARRVINQQLNGWGQELESAY